MVSPRLGLVTEDEPFEAKMTTHHYSEDKAPPWPKRLENRPATCNLFTMYIGSSMIPVASMSCEMKMTNNGLSELYTTVSLITLSGHGVPKLESLDFDFINNDDASSQHTDKGLTYIAMPREH